MRSDIKLVKSFLIVNMRGMVSTSTQVKDTLKSLNLEKKFRATIVPETSSYKGMLQKAKDQVSWCVATTPIIKKLLEKRGRKDGWKPLQQEDLSKCNLLMILHIHIKLKALENLFLCHQKYLISCYYIYSEKSVIF